MKNLERKDFLLARESRLLALRNFGVYQIRREERFSASWNNFLTSDSTCALFHLDVLVIPPMFWTIWAEILPMWKLESSWKIELPACTSQLDVYSIQDAIILRRLTIKKGHEARSERLFKIKYTSFWYSSWTGEIKPPRTSNCLVSLSR